MPITADILPDGIEALKAALAAERQARQEAEARATGAEAMVAHLKLVIAKLRRERFGPSAEPGGETPAPAGRRSALGGGEAAFVVEGAPGVGGFPGGHLAGVGDVGEHVSAFGGVLEIHK